METMHTIDQIEKAIEKRLRGEDGAPKQNKKQRFQKFLAGAGDTAKVPQQGVGAQGVGLVMGFYKSKNNARWTKVRVCILFDHGDNKKNYVDIPHLPKPEKSYEAVIAKYLKLASPPPRAPWKVQCGKVIELVSFNDKGIKEGELVWCSGLRWEIDAFFPYSAAGGGGGEDRGESNGPSEGDAIPQIYCENLNPFTDDEKLAELGKLLGNMKIGPVNELAYGGNPLPYPHDTPRAETTLTVGKNDVHNAMIPFDIPNEILFSNAQQSPWTVVHLSNKMYRVMSTSLPDIVDITVSDEATPPGPALCISKIPDRDNLVRDTLGEGKQTVKKAVLASAKGSAQNGDYSMTIADVDSDQEGTVLGIFWDNEIKKLGVQGCQAWEEYGTQIVRGLDALVSVKVDKSGCFTDEGRNKYYLKADRLTFIQVNLTETFRWIGVRVGLEVAEQVCLRGVYGKQWQTKSKKLSPRWKDVILAPNEVTLSSRLAADPTDTSIKVVCLAEATGEIATIVPPENWMYYLVPPGSYLSEPDPGNYLEELGFYKINAMSEGERAPKVDEITQLPNIDRWTVFAIRR